MEEIEPPSKVPSRLPSGLGANRVSGVNPSQLPSKLGVNRVNQNGKTKGKPSVVTERVRKPLKGKGLGACREGKEWAGGPVTGFCLSSGQRTVRVYHFFNSRESIKVGVPFALIEGHPL